jgi:putative oxygen-independent coproporphyrinogen III oxidase
MTTPNTPPPIRHLYIHVPFCPTICPYCDFHVLTRQMGMVDAYLAELEREAAALVREHPPELITLYLGGGTPSFLRDEELEQLVRVIKTHFGWVPSHHNGGEATIEVNPGTISQQRAQHWRNLGFDRASVGVQSLQTEVLRFLGRAHSPEQALSAIDILHNQGFRVSADLITAVPGQDLRQDLRALAHTGLDHLSAYTLTIEDGTEFARRGVVVASEAEVEALELAEAILHQANLPRYEVSNHAKPGSESRHNLAYWHNRFYYGLGPSASGHYPVLLPQHTTKNTSDVIATRRKNPPLAAWLRGERGLAEPVNRLDFVTDALFSGLRLRDGLDLAALSQRAGVDVASHFAIPLQQLVERGLLIHDHAPNASTPTNTLRASDAGLWVLNHIVAQFL